MRLSTTYAIFRQNIRYKIRLMLTRLMRMMFGLVRIRKIDCRGGAIGLRKMLSEWTRDEMTEGMVSIVMGDSETKQDGWFAEYLLIEGDNRRLRRLLSKKYIDINGINKALHISDLESKVKRLRAQVRTMQKEAEYKNNKLKATELIVNCTGCDAGGPHNYKNLTDDRVAEVSIIARRLASWWSIHKYRQEKVVK